MRTIEDALNRLRAEFLEMPGMHLKPEQVQRLCGVERGLCQTVLDSLVDAKFLCVSADGQYARVTDGEMASHRSRQTSESTRMPGVLTTRPRRLVDAPALQAKVRGHGAVIVVLRCVRAGRRRAGPLQHAATNCGTGDGHCTGDTSAATTHTGTAPVESDAGNRRTATRGERSGSGTGGTAHRRLPGPDRLVPVDQHRRRTRHRVRVDPLRRRRAGQRVRSTAHRGIFEAVDSRGRGVPRGGRAFSQAVRLFRDGLQRECAGKRGDHVVELYAQAQARVCGSPVWRDLLHVRRPGLHVDDARQGSAEHVAVRHRVDAGRGHELPGGDALGAPSAISRDVASVAAIQLGGVGRESRTADRERAGTAAGLLQQRHRGAGTTPGPTGCAFPI